MDYDVRENLKIFKDDVELNNFGKKKELIGMYEKYEKQVKMLKKELEVMEHKEFTRLIKETEGDASKVYSIAILFGTEAINKEIVKSNLKHQIS